MDEMIPSLLATLGQQIQKSRAELNEGLRRCVESIDQVEGIAAQSSTRPVGYSLTHDLNQHASGTTRRLAEMASLTERQRATAGDALGLIQEVAEVAGGMRKVTRASRRLALNATITSSRLGPTGRSLAMVAVQSKELASQIQEIADAVRETTLALEELLPELSKNGTALDEVFAEGRRDVDQANADLCTSADEIAAVTARMDQDAVSATRTVHVQAKHARRALEFGTPFEEGLAALEQSIQHAEASLVQQEQAA